MNWHPKPRRPVDPNPLFTEGDSYTIRKSSTLSPIERQRIQDGTPHTRGGRYSFQPGQIEPTDGPRLYIGGDAVEKSVQPTRPNVDELVKSFLAKGVAADEEEDTEKAAATPAPKSAPKAAAASAAPNSRPTPSTGAKTSTASNVGAAAGKVIGAAGGAAGAVGRTVASLASKR